MRTVKDEKKLIEMTGSILAGMKNNRPLFQELVRVTDQYQKQQAALAQTGVLLGECLGRIAKTQTQEDIEKAMTEIAMIVGETERAREEHAKVLLTGVITPMRVRLEAEKKDIPSFARDSTAARKRAQQTVKKAEEATKKAAKNPSTL
jgi:hypothetical protein